MGKVNLNIKLPKDILECTEEAGEIYREQIGLEDIEDKYETVEFIIYSNIKVIPIGFLIGLFRDSIKKCNSPDAFFNKFNFKYSGNDIYYDCIMEDIYAAVMRMISVKCN